MPLYVAKMVTQMALVYHVSAPPSLFTTQTTLQTLLEIYSNKGKDSANAWNPDDNGFQCLSVSYPV